jgi:hypothetical protein
MKAIAMGAQSQRKPPSIAVSLETLADFGSFWQVLGLALAGRWPSIGGHLAGGSAGERLLRGRDWPILAGFGSWMAGRAGAWLTEVL